MTSELVHEGQQNDWCPNFTENVNEFIQNLAPNLDINICSGRIVYSGPDERVMRFITCACVEPWNYSSNYLRPSKERRSISRMIQKKSLNSQSQRLRFFDDNKCIPQLEQHVIFWRTQQLFLGTIEIFVRNILDNAGHQGLSREKTV